MIIHIRATYPTRTLECLNQCINKYEEIKDQYDSLRTITKVEKTPFKMYIINESCETLIPLFKEIMYGEILIKEPYNQCRQILPQTYIHNGCIDILKVDTILKGSMTGDNIYPFIMDEENHDIDTIEDLNKIDLKRLNNLKMKDNFFDILINFYKFSILFDCHFDFDFQITAG